jgi:hypothetical protein
MDMHGHHFRDFGSVEQICRCGFVIARGSTPEQVEELMRDTIGYVSRCSGQWHVHLPLR